MHLLFKLDRFAKYMSLRKRLSYKTKINCFIKDLRLCFCAQLAFVSFVNTLSQLFHLAELYERSVLNGVVQNLSLLLKRSTQI